MRRDLVILKTELSVAEAPSCIHELDSMALDDSIEPCQECSLLQLEEIFETESNDLVDDIEKISVGYKLIRGFSTLEAIGH